VLDEADKLLEMGFQEELDQIRRAMPRKRQSILFSATMPDGVKQLIEASLTNPQFIEASATALPDQVKTIGIKLAPGAKKEVVANLLNSLNYAGTVIFTNTRATADELTAYLQQHDIPANPLHGGMEQTDRDKTMTLFRNGTYPVLVATDLAARGLDVAALNTIIHFELPDDEAAYLHRSGRTGRAGRSGTVYTFLTNRDERKQQEWEQMRLDEWLEPEKISSKKTEKAEVVAFDTLHINAGRKDKISPRDIVGALIAEAGLKADQIGKIEVQDKVSFVAVPKAQSAAIAQKLSNGKIKGRKFKVSLVR
ncbi:MAG: DbpA RNA binding domain-containing protein, partial [Hymenobacteraceae bacterium]|nr:DbpA RNA binding domain-containing protein [Hymenobacteraceae bacterium]MDX5397936.1 DbpA RNA binding domain-containing protein [Hymenobacteraceae bacterium]MDX5514005.1 DbpA RNA binding domain-containing protein [Hymenobacteraceae bacterium]